MLVKVKCVICGKEFLVKPSRLKNGQVKYCSQKCFGIGYGKKPKSEVHKMRIGESNRRAYAEGRKRNVAGPNNPRWGKHCTEETKQKIRLTQLGKPGLPGKLNPMWGKHPSAESIKKQADAQRGKPKHSEEHKQIMRERFKVWNPTDSPEVRKKISDALKGKMGGSNNPNWSGGSKDYCGKWDDPFRERIRAWFGYQCIECGTLQDGHKLSCHHVYYDKKACCSVEENGIYKSNLGRKDMPKTFEIIGDPNKFILLCNHCHTKTNGSKSREKWARHFEEIINSYYGGKSYLSKEEMIVFSQSPLLTAI
jgi:hypothetical protein